MELQRLPHILLIFLLFTAWSCQSDGNSAGNGNAQDVHQDSALGQENGMPDTPAPRKGNYPGIAEDYENTNRVIWQKPDMVIDLLGDLDNKTIADIGAGTGFFALRLAPKAKKVIAIDIDPRFINYLDSVKVLELPESMQSNLETRLARPNDPMLQPEEADLVMIVNTFMYIKDKVEYLEILKRGISDGGRLLIIDFKKKRTPLGPPSEIRTPLYEVEEKLYEAGYRNVTTNDTALDYQYIITAEK